MDATLYSTNCPKCKVLETKLTQMGIKFDTVTDNEEVAEVGKSNGILSAPILKVEDKYFDFSNAIKYLKEIANNAN